MKKHTLSFKPEINFSVIGIVSNAAEYKLAFEVNTAVKISLDKSETLLSFAPKKKKNESYEAYLFIEETERLRYYLVKTKQGSNLLFPDYKQIDYAFIVLGNNRKNVINNIKKHLDKVAIIQSTFAIPIASTENLILEDIEEA